MKKIIRRFFYLLFFLITVLAVTGVLNTDDIEIPDETPGDHIEIMGQKIRYFQIGKGRDIVFIHGAPGTIDDWDPMIHELTGKYRLTFFDRPGYGYSSSVKVDQTDDEKKKKTYPKLHNLEHNSETVLELLKALKLKNVTLVGHGYGGTIALKVAAKAPKGVSSYIIVGAPAYGSLGKNPVYYLIRIPVIGKGFATITTTLFGTMLLEKNVSKSFYPNEPLVPKNYIEKRLNTWLQAKSLVSYSTEKINLKKDLNNLVPQYASITLKRKRFMIVHGDQDQLVPVDEAKKLHKIIKKSKITILADTSHMIQYDNTTELLRIVQNKRKERFREPTPLSRRPKPKPKKKKWSF
ncbi:MAG: alpha/beta hydrolase [bacterium]|nr:alpha/beta hydrolase [bacterium]